MRPTKLRPSQGGKMHGPVAAGTSRERYMASADEYCMYPHGVYTKTRGVLSCALFDDKVRTARRSRAAKRILDTEYHRRAGELARVTTPAAAPTRTERWWRQMTASELVVNHRALFCDKVSLDMFYMASGQHIRIVDVTHAAFGESNYLVTVRGSDGSGVALKPLDVVTVRVYDVV